MRIPNENLYAYDFNSNAAQPKSVGPPPVAELRLSGNIEVLKPLARCEDFMKSEAAGGTLVRPVPNRLSWFHRSLAVGGLAVLVLLGSSFFIAMYGPPPEPADGLISAISPADVAMDGQPVDILTAAEELGDSASLQAVDSPSVFEGFLAVRKV